MNISTIFQQSGFLYDRFLGNTLQLPYTFNQIQIAENETSTADIYNLKASYLYQNFLYLYKSTQLASNLIPISAIATAGLSALSAGFNWYSGLSTSQFLPLSLAGLCNVDDTAVMSVQPNTSFDQYSIFTSSGPDLVVFNSTNSQSSITLELSSQEIYQGANIYFQNIVSFAFNNTDLYVLDLSANSIYKYNAAGFLTNSNIFQNSLQYQATIGGRGTVRDKTKFNHPQGIAIQNNNLYVLDSGNSCVKQYDPNLNWIYTFELTRDLLSAYPINIGVDSLSGNIWILSDNNKILQYSPDFTQKQVIDLSSLQNNNEQFISLTFSPQNDNIFYLVSNQNVYKKLVDNPNNTIGKYLFYLFDFNTAENIQAFASLAVPGGDQNIVFSVASGAGKFSAFFDNINLDTILSVADFDVYSESEIYLDPNEYIQNWVINKSLLKMLNNHIRLSELFIGKFTGSRDANNNIVYMGVQYLSYEELQAVNLVYDMSFFIGLNEILQNVIINRAFLKIYNIQQNLLNILQDQINAAPFNANTIVFLG
jgi:hypothetical protein